MKLFGASITETVDTFLHAGYISAYPRPFESYSYPSGDANASVEKVVELDMTRALDVGSAPLDGGVTDASAALVSSGSNSELLVGALTATGLLIAAYLIQRYLKLPKISIKPIGAAIAVVAALLLSSHCGGGVENLPDDPPWQGATVRAYENPDQATLAILHGIIRPAVSKIGQEVASLANIQHEVGLPKASLTEGESYALAMYGLDGYGNPFDFKSEKTTDGETDLWVYTVTSPGPDGRLGTDDDISVTFDQTINSNWGWGTGTVFYIVRNGDSSALLYHRWKNKMFEYADKESAEAICESELFDVIPRDRLTDEQKSAVDKAFGSAAETNDKPLLLQVFAQKGA